MRIDFVLASAVFMVTACGGGGSGGKLAQMTQQPDETPAMVAPTKIAFAPSSSGHYRTDGLPGPAISDAKYMPIYRDDDRILVGVEQTANFLRSLPVIAKTASGADIRYGIVDDGAGGNIVREYLNQVTDVLFSHIVGFEWDGRPQVTYGGHASPDDVERLIRSIQLVNVALPESRKMELPSASPYPLPQGPNSGIHVFFLDPENDPDYWGITFNTRNGDTLKSNISISAHYTDAGDRRATILLAHEILHALGLGDHVAESHDSILEAGRGIYERQQNSPQPLSLLYNEDREALRGLYDPSRLGSWANTGLHIAGHGQHTAFGVALRNGYAEPWAYGYTPNSDLADNRSLSGSVKWSGELLGLTPDAAAVAGDAAINVNLPSMTGRADFTNLETWGGNTAPGAAGSGATWLDGDLGYGIAVRGNTFRETGGDDGRLTGIFTGRSHEGAAGTLDRTDLTASFGASR